MMEVILTEPILFVMFYSETVKFGHVTFFWNGNRSGYFDANMEEYVEIPSDSGITFNVQPKMKAVDIAEKARDAILSRKFDQVETRPKYMYGLEEKVLQLHRSYSEFYFSGSCKPSEWRYGGTHW